MMTPQLTENAILWWLGLGVAVIIGVAVLAVIVRKPKVGDLEPVSSDWIASHKVDAPERW